MKKSLSLLLAMVFLLSFPVYSGEPESAAEATWEKRIAENPADANVMIWASNFYRDAGNLERAVSLAKRAVELEPENVWHLRNLADIYKIAGDDGELENVYKRIVEVTDEQWFKDWATGELLNIYQRQNRLDEVLPEFAVGLEERPDDITQYNRLGELYVRKGEMEKAIEIYKKALEVFPDNRVISERMLSIYEARGNFSEAIMLLQKMISMAPNEASLLERVANLYNEVGKKEDAKNTWETVLAMVKDDPSLHSKYAGLLYRWGDVDAALAQIAKAEGLDAGNLNYTLEKAVMLKDSGRIEEARKAFEKVSAEAKEDWMKAEADKGLDEMGFGPKKAAKEKEIKPVSTSPAAKVEQEEARVEEPKKQGWRRWLFWRR